MRATALLMLRFGLATLVGSVAPTSLIFGTDLEAAWQRYISEQAGSEPGLRFPFESCFRLAAREFDLPLTLLLAVARGESDFDTKARSNRDAYGLMQIRWPQTARHLGIRDIRQLYEPCTNVRAGARYLAELMQHYDGNLYLTLAAYNYGPARIPANAAPGDIPDGARWYSDYIYKHLRYVLAGSTIPVEQRGRYEAEGKLEVLVFHRPYRAEAFVTYLETEAPRLRLDWFRDSLGRFRVMLIYRDQAELSEGKRVLRENGIRLN